MRSRYKRRLSGAMASGLKVAVPRRSGRMLTLRPSERRRLRNVAGEIQGASSRLGPFGRHLWQSSKAGPVLLFVGSSVERRALAATHFAAQLRAPLLRSDLSQIVSRFIGETEKNLEQLLVAAERRGAILLFDEADALFGKRTDVKDSHDRFANTEMSYLLQRLERHRSIVILSTNSEDGLDTAFLRRVRHVLQFLAD